MSDEKTIGIGITTRNRPEILDIAIQHFYEFWPEGYSVKFIVVEDQSDDEYFEAYFNLAAKYPWVCFSFVPRMGIAAAKNECLKFLKDCDYIFLFDDDCFPQKRGWHDLYITVSQVRRAEHMMHLEEVGIIKKVTSVGSLVVYNNCAGCMLFLTKKALETLGGFNKNFGLYGYEHAEYSIRAHRSGLSGAGKYSSPVASGDYIYSIDIKNAIHSGLGISERKNVNPPLATIPDSFRSSMTDEEKNVAIRQNAQVFSETTPIYQEL